MENPGHAILRLVEPDAGHVLFTADIRPGQTRCRNRRKMQIIFQILFIPEPAKTLRPSPPVRLGRAEIKRLSSITRTWGCNRKL